MIGTLGSHWEVLRVPETLLVMPVVMALFFPFYVCSVLEQMFVENEIAKSINWEMKN